VWGFTDPIAKDRAVDCGTAFQLTNILRDLQEDARVGRIYLPREELQQFDYSGDDIRNGVRNDRFGELMRFQVERARGYYERGIELLPLLHSPGRPILSAMITIYGRLLRMIERSNYDVFTRRVELPTATKMLIALNHTLRPGRPPRLP
jgi:phytoene synthase